LNQEKGTASHLASRTCSAGAATTRPRRSSCATPSRYTSNGRSPALAPARCCGRADILRAPSGHARQAALDHRHGRIGRAGNHGARIQQQAEAPRAAPCPRRRQEDGRLRHAHVRGNRGRRRGRHDFFNEKLAAAAATSRLKRALSIIQEDAK
jgi:hypothetical protein